MNAYPGGNVLETHSEQGKLSNDYEIILKLSVTDISCLWQAAAERLRSCSLDLEDIEDTIGPIDDPAIKDCLMLLAMPASIDGCAFGEVDIYAGGRPPLVLVKNEIRPQERPLPARPLPSVEMDKSVADWRTGLDATTICICGNMNNPDRAPALPN